MNIAIVGATGLVGSKMLQILEERNFSIDKIIPIASQKSEGRLIDFCGKKYTVVPIENSLNEEIDIALFSAGAEVSLKWAPQFKRKGIYVIDNSSAWRMSEDIKLIIPEINGNLLESKDKIIANPNCSTIQMLMALAPIHKKFKIKRIIISTYQSVTGTGKAAIDQLNNEKNNIKGLKIYPHQIHQNALPQCDIFLENGYTKEEMKLVNETHKILSDKSIKVSATAVRVPVFGGHAESVNIELKEKTNCEDINFLLNKTDGVVVQDDPKKNIYPMPINAEGKDEVFVGRIRKDYSKENSFNLWIVSDNLRKGAATNTIQIAEYLVKNNLIKK
tara:strand:+ start:2249 stop:3244 length:996 start_codon:yes stop_codon:yes gene_type:complete